MLNWDSSYSVGVKELDDQHKKMFKLIQGLKQSLGNTDNRDAVVTVLNSLVAYTKDHFATEEFYFKQFDYEHIDAHIAEHIDLIKAVEKLVYRFEVGETIDMNQVIDFLNAWWSEHILGADQEYVNFFKGNGLA